MAHHPHPPVIHGLRQSVTLQNSNVWALHASDGLVWYWNGTAFQDARDRRLLSVAAGTQGMAPARPVWGIDQYGTPCWWDGLHFNLVSANAGFDSIFVGSADNVWSHKSDGSLWRYTDGAFVLTAGYDLPEWQTHIQWAFNNTDAGGSVGCAADYAAAADEFNNAGIAECVIYGGRSCVMNFAISAAKANDFNQAFQLTLLTQCQNDEAAAAIRAAGQYLARSSTSNRQAEE
jgi:hypothetical protein